MRSFRTFSQVVGPSKSMTDFASSETIVSTICLFRHGARFDLATPNWKEKIVQYGGLINDPPLSAIGHEQSREMARKLGNVKADGILVSPYLRTIQTAVPFSEQIGLPICLEHGLAEAPHVLDVLPDAFERYLYFPQIDTDHISITLPVASPDEVHIELNKPQENFPLGYFTRILRFAEALEHEGFGKTLLCFSHAASVALVAALLKCNIEDIPADDNCRNNARTDLFAPLGMYKLTRQGNSRWTLVSNGSTNNDLRYKDPHTYPWGYDEYCRKTWKGLL